MPNIERTVHSALYILNLSGGKIDIHRMFKILFFADQKHMVTFGRPISGDRYIAMRHGPVPSFLMDVVKLVRGDGLFTPQGDFVYDDLFEMQGNRTVIAKCRPDMDVLPESAVHFLNESFSENAELPFGELSEKSHQRAWSKSDPNDEIDPILIAEDGGANGEMLKYLHLNMENQNLRLCHVNLG